MVAETNDKARLSTEAAARNGAAPTVSKDAAEIALLTARLNQLEREQARL